MIDFLKVEATDPENDSDYALWVVIDTRKEESVFGPSSRAACISFMHGATYIQQTGVNGAD